MCIRDRDKIVAQANEPLDSEGHFVNLKVAARGKGGEIDLVPREAVDYMDVSPKQVVSVATAMIPFLENDDANRALMGANMQRQAVPLLVTEAPIVGTGMEHKAAKDSGVVIIAKHSGTIDFVDADKIVVLRDDGEGKDEYTLLKFKRSNQGTCINQRPIVYNGEHVEQGEVIADGPSTENGEIALGKNLLIGFMTWEGYNYEDAIILNERPVSYTHLDMNPKYTEPGTEKVVDSVDVEVKKPEPKKAADKPADGEKKADAASGEDKLTCDLDVCVYCGLCAKNCPCDALTVDRKEKVWKVDEDACVKCGACVDKCPKKCLSL